MIMIESKIKIVFMIMGILSCALLCINPSSNNQIQIDSNTINDDNVDPIGNIVVGSPGDDPEPLPPTYPTIPPPSDPPPGDLH